LTNENIFKKQKMRSNTGPKKLGGPKSLALVAEPLGRPL